MTGKAFLIFPGFPGAVGTLNESGTILESVEA